jgi:hypothetical protein
MTESILSVGRWSMTYFSKMMFFVLGGLESRVYSYIQSDAELEFYIVRTHAPSPMATLSKEWQLSQHTVTDVHERIGIMGVWR